MPLKFFSADDFAAYPLGFLGTSNWRKIDQDVIDRFADATDDRQWIHVNQTRALRDMPDGRTIAHGFLSLALLPKLIDDIFQVENLNRGFNYGLDGVRFLAPVKAGSRIQLNCGLIDVMLKAPHIAKVTLDCSCLIEREAKPAWVAKFIGLYEFESNSRSHSSIVITGAD